MEKEGRILNSDWIRYTAGEVVFKPARMTPDALQNMYEYAWNTFYADCSKEVKMAKLFLNVIRREREDGTYRQVRLRNTRTVPPSNK